MKAVSPLRSRPGSGGLLPGRRTRGKSPVLPEEGLSDMERCYRLLRAMVPGLRPDRSLSRVDLLQHVIDYILDLQTALEPGSHGRKPPEPPGPRGPPVEPAVRSPFRSPRAHLPEVGTLTSDPTGGPAPPGRREYRPPGAGPDPTLVG
ncbi:DNA-binding protein inhibitor ID-2b [Gadus chalcogrammus]|uniref:DNA-binding protein inhibitor ID-2b n=1 Tax=Gadus chalcogrammus TaxID=1042646 RepID=UPI0024C47FED|nr:DNA-binding protein inhibitor ID-2b [Gadus chalcogrammus]